MDSVVHFEIPATDLERAKKFYAGTFGWQLSDMPEMNYVIAMSAEVGANRMPKKPGTINGGMMKRNNMVSGPSFAIEVQDIDTAIKKVKASGGTMVSEKMPVGEMGFLAYFKDTEGNVLSLWQSARG